MVVGGILSEAEGLRWVWAEVADNDLRMSRRAGLA